MGLYDRDYSLAGDGEPHFGARVSSHPAWLVILIITAAVFLIDSLFFSRSHLVNYWLSVHDDTLLRPWKWWQWLTYGLAHGDIWHLVFNMIGLFFFGSAIERRLGRNEFVRFYIVAILFGGFVWSVATTLASSVGMIPANERPLMLGASGGVEAVCILFCFFYPHAKILLFLVLPVKAWVVGVMFVVMNLLGAISGEGQTAYEVHLAGIAFAAAYFLGGWNLEFLSPAWITDLPSRVRSRRPKLRLHDPDKKLAREAAEADRVLQKIHDQGEASLTAAERRVLERYSRRIRGK